MPNTKPNIKSKIGNVNHPFSEKENKAALKMWGSHPARQAVVNSGGAVYDALQEFKNAQTNFGANTPASVVNPNQNINPNAASVALPEVKIGVFGSGSYENPTATTNPNANDNTSTVNTYSFMDDLESINQWKKDNPNKNVFGFPKRDSKSFDARIKDAEDRGKSARVARLKRRKKEFEDNQARKVNPDSDTYQKANPDYDPNVAGSQKTIETDKGGKFANFFKSLF